MSDRDERGSRLSKRFERDRSETSESSESAESSKQSQQSKTSKSDKTAKGNKISKTDKSSKTDTSDQASVKDRPSVLMYLPQEQHDELDVRFDELNARYKRETGEKLKKNRDYYPMVVEKGLESITLEDFLEG